MKEMVNTYLLFCEKRYNQMQARSQAEARKPRLQHDARNPDFVACEQQRRRSDCASAQSDQRFCYSLSEK